MWYVIHSPNLHKLFILTWSTFFFVLMSRAGLCPWLTFHEGADRVRGRGGRRGGGRREKRGWEEGEEGEGRGRRGAGGGRGRGEAKREGGEKRKSALAPEGRRETRGQEGGGRGWWEGERPTPLSAPSFMLEWPWLGKNGQVYITVPMGATCTFTKLGPTVDMIYWCHVLVCVLDLNFMLEWPWLRRNG